MTTPQEVPGHGPQDPPGYVITETPDGYVWTRLRDDKVSKPYPTREKAVAAAWKDAGLD